MLFRATHHVSGVETHKVRWDPTPGQAASQPEQPDLEGFDTSHRTVIGSQEVHVG